MSESLRAIAARYASVLKASEKLTATGGGDRPSVLDIWLWKLEYTVLPLVEIWKGRKQKPDLGGYDHFHLYAHRFCLDSKEDVQAAPESVLLEAMGLAPPPVGWLQFMVRALGWHSMIAANWGWSVLKIPDGVTYSTTTEAQRRRQSVHYFLELMRERGADTLAEVRGEMARRLAEYKERESEELGQREVLRQLAGRDPWTFFVYAYGGKPNPPELLTPLKEPAYTGEQRVNFAAEIRATAARRRRNINAPHSCDCVRLQAEKEEADGRETERAGVAHVLEGERVTRRGEDIGVAPEGEELAQLSEHLEAWTSAEYHIRNSYLHDRFEIYLARNGRARDQLRLPENRELAVKVKTEARWLYVPDVSDRDLGPSKMSGLTDEQRAKAAEIRRMRAD